MKRTKERYLYLDYIAVLFLIMASGSVQFFFLHAMPTVVGLFLFGIYYYYRKRNIIVNKSNKTVVALIILYFIFNRFVINNDVSEDSTWIYTYCMLAIGAFCILSKIDYEKFKRVLLNLVALIAIKSILVFGLYEAGVITPSVVTHNNSIYLMFMMETLGWSGPFHRMAGMFWEPGACQVIFDGTLILFLLDFFQKKLKKWDNIKFLTILGGAILTFSTAAYFMLLLFVVFYLFTTLKNARNIKNIIILLISLPIAIYIGNILLNSDVIQGKLNQKGVDDTSYEIRRNDNLGMIYMITQRPIFGSGMDTETYRQYSLITDNRTSSNGILSYAASFGLVFIIPLLLRIYRNTNRFSNKLLIRVLFFFLIVFLNCFEVFMYFPFTYIFILRFGRDKYKLSRLS